MGRHSMMNGVSFGSGDISDAAIKDFVAFFSGLTLVWKRIFEWAPEEAGRLAASAGWDNLDVRGIWANRS